MYFQGSSPQFRQTQPFQTILTRPSTQYYQQNNIRNNQSRSKEKEIILDDKNEDLDQDLIPKKLQIILIFLIFFLVGYCLYPWQFVQVCKEKDAQPYGNCTNGKLVCNSSKYKVMIDPINGKQKCGLKERYQQLIQTELNSVIYKERRNLGDLLCQKKEKQQIQISKSDIQDIILENKELSKHAQEVEAELKSQTNQLNFGYEYKNDTIIIYKNSALKNTGCIIKETFLSYWKGLLLGSLIGINSIYLFIKMRFKIKQHNLAQQIFKEWQKKIQTAENNSINIEELKEDASVEYPDLADENLWKLIEEKRQKYGGKIFLGPGYWILNKRV